MNKEAEKYVEKAKAMVATMPQVSGNPPGDVAQPPVLVPVGEIPLRFLEFKKGHKTTELAVLGVVSALLGVAALWAGLDLSTWAYCQTGIGGLYIHARGMAKQRRR